MNTKRKDGDVGTERGWRLILSGSASGTVPGSVEVHVSTGFGRGAQALGGAQRGLQEGCASLPRAKNSTSRYIQVHPGTGRPGNCPAFLLELRLTSRQFCPSRKGKGGVEMRPLRFFLAKRKFIGHSMIMMEFLVYFSQCCDCFVSVEKSLYMLGPCSLVGTTAALPDKPQPTSH